MIRSRYSFDSKVIDRTPMSRRVVLCILALALDAMALDASPRDIATSENRAALTAIKRSPLELYLAKGERDTCGEGCSEWIAAVGYFDPGSSERLRAFLKRIPNRTMPIYFHSLGGVAEQGISIGRLLRQRGMTVGVGKTVPDACVEASNESCGAAKRSGDTLPAHLYSVDATCNSACIWALIGGKVRQVPPGVRIGVHANRLVSKEKDVEVSDARSEFRANAQRYIQEMGIDRGLFDVIFTVPTQSIRYLSRDEIAGFGIDSHRLQETRWTIIEMPSQPLTVAKLIVEAKSPGNMEFRTSLIRLVCGGEGKILVGYIRDLGLNESDTTSAIKLVADARAIIVQNARYFNKINQLPTEASVDGGQLFAPVEFFDSAASAGTLEVGEIDRRENSMLPLPIRTFAVGGLAEGVAALRRSCR
jgi:hypothetical protein